ncbi:copper amine oxidase N-terminal domain-containing protein [Paenibacillus glycanilyticus]|uniref:copper amine oxidase N-terminal domain-containing protein n=1 Tax=Paenibacillus glycanilyticus TaxID=126569 RepID=UPI00203DFC97|nr:copper amine oxidase N-terminal domain-containing protein [Paenibacillus glycanilyticus]MCM3626639.1 copper amine oxidase N-terminal domain-containing protein [Paenibacillus glycanilyticus]
MNTVIKRNLAILLSFILLLAAMNLGEKKAFADSPVTSTTFYKAYLDLDIVAKAHKSGFSTEIAEFLAAEKNPLDQKAAVMNAIYSSYSWNERDIVNQYSKAVYGKPASELNIKLLRGDELFVLGYLKVLDHYLEPDTYWIGLASESLPKSMTVALINALAKSQDSFDLSYCYLERVLADKNLVKDIRQEAIAIITDYIDLYKKDEGCSDQVTELMNNSIGLIINKPKALVFGGLQAVDSSNSKVAPYIRKGVTYVPLVFISHALGATVQYDKKREEITIRHASLEYMPSRKLVFNLKDAKNRYEVQNGRAFVPLRAIAEPLRMKVYYSKGLIILSKGIALHPQLAYDQQLANEIRGKIEDGKLS